MFTVYSITGKNGMVYVGSTTTSSKTRWANHKCLLRNKKHKNAGMQGDWNAHGEDFFVVGDLAHTDDLDKLRSVEQEFIAKYRAAGKCYNVGSVVPHPMGEAFLKSYHGRPRTGNVTFVRRVPEDAIPAISKAFDEWMISGYPVEENTPVESKGMARDMALHGKNNQPPKIIPYEVFEKAATKVGDERGELMLKLRISELEDQVRRLLEDLERAESEHVRISRERDDALAMDVDARIAYWRGECKKLQLQLANQFAQ